MFLTVGLKISHPGTKIPFIAQIQKEKVLEVSKQTALIISINKTC